ncbi:hypothetical protein M9H77_23072 [Catharanthus roseus]|uniref:Uncharacterized protein n=1 Tax=Catharanthus roseus TaxID=4058 RepID=A0ACC0AUF1_CATRO|nr:hypothetical protein M9H77_23072 [Catharanthus roseus]
MKVEKVKETSLEDFEDSTSNGEEGLNSAVGFRPKNCLEGSTYSHGRVRPTVVDMQEHQGVVTRAKAKQLKSHKDQIEQENFQGLNFNVQHFIGPYAKVLNKLEIENSPWYMVGSPFARAGKLPHIFGNVLTSALE